ncbi:hypothetical protein M0811_12515 [Anaeramoeba ignava]|uniref:VWFA domain-containing protein n=1 Tax=Anaeramoeba ignava TaxID=1746090 RepID=A0A9Q0L9D3_ANAIG|nr:hypothetical protein M0811_12515 [Anaeramoeba ignava]
MFDITSNYHIIDNTACITLTVTHETKASKIATKKPLSIIMLDISGSMSGAALRNAVSAVQSLVRNIYEENELILITYNHEATAIPLGMGLENAVEYIGSLKAFGSTNFVIAFQELEDIINQTEIRDIRIIFFTDGQDTHDNTRNQTKVRSELANLKKVLDSKTLTSSIHTIGFTEEHDARLLSEITLAGKTQGTFQYVKEAKDIPNTMEIVTSLVADAVFVSAKLLDSQNVEIQKVFLEIEDQNDLIEIKENQNTDMVIDNEQEKQDEKDQGRSRNGTHRSNVSDKKQIIHSLRFISDQLSKLTATIIDPKTSRDELEKIRATVFTFDEKTNELSLLVMKLRNFQKKKMMPEIAAVKKHIADFHEVLSSAFNRTLNNDIIARLNAMAYRRITKQGLRKKLDKRMEANVKLFEDIEKKVEQITDNYDFEEMKEKYKEQIEEFGTCFLSCRNWIECLEDGDCLCLSLDVGRSESSIADPTQVVIKKIYSSMISAESFLQSVEYSLFSTTGGKEEKVDGEEKKQIRGLSVPNAETVHGGFDKSVAAKVISGQSRESITGALPLFISPEHWRIAQLRMKGILGWTATLDVMGYTFAQVKSIPFLVLAKSAESLNTQFEQKQFKMILDTCLAIYKSTASIFQDFLPVFQKYTLDPFARTIDSVPNNFIFLMHAYCAKQNGDLKQELLDNLFKFTQYVSEEEIRRHKPFQFRELDSSQIDDLMWKILDIDEDLYINNHILDFKEKNKPKNPEKEISTSFEENQIISVLKSRKNWTQQDLDLYNKLHNIHPQTNQEDDEKPKNSENSGEKENQKYSIQNPEEFNGDIKSTQHLDTLFKQYVPVFQFKIKPLMNSISLIDPTIQKENSTLLANLGIKTTQQKVTLLIQCLKHGKNSDRREAISNQAIVDPFSEKESMDFIKKTFVDLVQKKRRSLENEYLQSLQRQKLGFQAGNWGATHNIYEAAGILLGAYQGSNFDYYIRQLQDEKCPLFVEKFKMLTTGQFRGIKLIADKIKSLDKDDFVIWSPSKINFHRILKMNKDLLSADEWKELCPKWSRIIDIDFNL